MPAAKVHGKATSATRARYAALPISIFLRNLLPVWKTNASSNPVTVNTPPMIAQTYAGSGGAGLGQMGPPTMIAQTSARTWGRSLHRPA